MKSKIIYIVIGILLVLGYVKTSSRGIDDNTLDLIVDSQKIDTNSIWKGFELEKYPVDVNYGASEYRYYNGDTIKKKPDIKVLALSAMDTEVGPVIKTLPEAQVRKIIDSGDLSLEERNKIYKSVLVHEAFHCYQIEKGAEGINVDSGNVKSDELEGFKKYSELLQRIDKSETFRNLWVKEMVDLEKYYKTGESDAWVASRSESLAFEKDFFGEDYELFRKYVNNRELIEGTARYVEEASLVMMKHKVKTGFSGLYTNGDEKYYESGCLKANILDNEKEWKEIRFDDSISLDELLLSD